MGLTVLLDYPLLEDMTFTFQGIRRWYGVLGLSSMLWTGCASSNDVEVIRVWSHQGQEAENQAMRAIADAFNEAHANQQMRVELTFFPDHQYTEKISIAAAANDLPDALGIDGPTLAQFVDAGLLAPLEPYFEKEELTDFLPTIVAQGTIDGTLYALGAFDSAMVLYYDKDRLAAAAVLPPPRGTAWTWAEFVDACHALKAVGDNPVALHMDITGDEWYTYAFSPLIWSAGGQLIDVPASRVQGVLNAPENVAVLQDWQRLFEAGLAARAPINPDPFGSGETAMDWSGHWMARSHVAAKGDKLGVMPLPRTGPTPAAACGSWCWALNAHSPRRDTAAKWLRWVTHPEHGKAIVAASGAVPARRSALHHFPEYANDPWRLFMELLEEHGRPRPQTPFYPNLTQHFAAAVRDIAHGADPQARLDRAAEAVQRIIDRQTGMATP